MLTSAHDRANDEDGIGDDDCRTATKELKEWVHKQRSYESSSRIYGGDVAGDLVLVRCIDAKVSLEGLLGNGSADKGRVVTISQNAH